MSSTLPIPPSDEPAPAPLLPPHVPDHELIRRIGRGAYGEVWLARSVTGAFRAVKMVHRRSFDHDRPFEREFEGILKFEPISRTHDSQVDILHVGRGEDCFYYVMELADDQTTGGQTNPDAYAPRTLKSDLIFHGRLPFEECVRVGIALATALEHLHANGLVHRDVKPSNIIFVNGVPKLADIGLVTGVDATRSYVGTEGFAAPEGPGTAQADLYSLGKVLYEAATGKDRQEFPELPTQLRELPDRDGLMELNAVIARACRHDPKDRYPSAAAMRADLELLQSGKSLARLHKTEARLRFVQRAGAVVTLAAALIAAGWFWQARQTHLVRDLADQKNRLANEIRERLVRLDVANGVRLMDAGDLSGAALWFAAALPLVTNQPAEESIHRIRLQQVLAHSPRLLQVWSHGGNVGAGAFSRDGQRIATVSANQEIRVWDAVSGALLMGPVGFGANPRDVRFTRDGRRLLVRQFNERAYPQPITSGRGKVAVFDSGTGEVAFPAITNAVMAAFSPDERWLAVARTNHAIEILDASTGQRVTELLGHTNQINMLTFSRDGSLLASASSDQTVRLWRLPSGEEFGPAIQHDGPVQRLALSPDARRMATFAERAWWFGGHTVQIWSLPGGRPIGSPIQVKQQLFALAFGETSGQWLFTGDNNRWMSVWDTDSHAAALPPLTLEQSSVRCWAFSPDGISLAMGGDDHTARVWDLRTGQPTTPWLRHGGWVESVQFSPDGSRLLTTSDDGTAKLWDLATTAEAAQPLRLEAKFMSVRPESFPCAVSPEGSRLLIGGLNEYALLSVRLHPLAQDGLALPTPDRDVAGELRFDERGRQWAAALGALKGGGRSKSVALWCPEDGRLRLLSLAHDRAVRLVRFSQDGALLTTVGDDPVLRRWRTRDGSLAGKVLLPDEFAWAEDLSLDTSRLLFQRKDRAWEILDLTRPVAGRVPLPADAQILKGRFSPDGTRLATIGPSQYGRVWDARTGQPVTPLFKHRGSLHSLEWSPDGKRLLTAGASPDLKMWDAASGEQLLSAMTISDQNIGVGHFSPDGRFIVARSDDHFVRVWHAGSSEAVTPLLQHEAFVRSALISPKNRLVTVSDPGTIRAWDLTETSLPAPTISDYARLLAGRRLEPTGRLEFMPAAELESLRRSLCAQHPACFASDTNALRRWHHRQIPALTSLACVTAASFHLDELQRLQPDDPELPALRAKADACRIPPRDAAATTNMIDLSPFYTHSFGLLPLREFETLPHGVQNLGGTQFDVRGFLCLGAADGGPATPAGDSFSNIAFPKPEVRGVEVGRCLRALHFLQAVAGSQAKDGEEVARWVVHYADGSTAEVPIIYGEQVLNWWWKPGRPVEPSQAAIAWEGKLPKQIAEGPERVRLFKSTWSNPRPEVEIEQLDFVLGKARVRPLVVAITAE